MRFDTIPHMPIALRYLLAFVVAAVVVIAGYNAFWPGVDVTVEPVIQREEVPHGEPTFSWSYSTDESGEIPRTRITLRAMYFDGTSRTKEIDTVDGTCNVYPSPETDVYPKSDQIICYYAGFGLYYKVVVTGNGTYAVQRREFEEASPDYDPPVTGFETIVVF